MRRSLIYWLILLPAFASAQTPQQLPLGHVISNVACTGDPSETYALYLPSNYTPAKPWPVIYAFDPDARGEVPVEIYREAAEKYGYILVGSNTIRNFSAHIAASLGVLWQDTHRRFALDPARTYMTGFSGGARVAGEAAALCAQCKIAAVIAEGAGYPDENQPAKSDPILYFFAVGDQDFNWPEIVKVRRHREDAGLSYRVQTFAGTHQWAPAAVADDAVEWIRLKAMQAGTQPKEKDFIDGMFHQTEKEFDDATRAGDTIAALGACRSLVSDFDGLEEVAPFQARLNEIKKSSGFKQAAKAEDRSMEEQQTIYSQIGSQMAALPGETGQQLLDTRSAVMAAMKKLQDDAKKTNNAEKRMIYLRAFNQLWIHGAELGQSELAQNRPVEAANYFEVMSEITPNEPWLQILLAEASAARGDKKRAIQYLHEAVKRGFNDGAALEQNENLKALHSEPGFQQIMDSLKPAPAGSHSPDAALPQKADQNPKISQ